MGIRVAIRTLPHAAGKKAQLAATTKHGYRAQLGRVLDDIRRIVTIQTRMLVPRRALGADAIAALSDPLS